MRLLFLLKIYHIRLFIVRKKGFGTISRQCGICSKPQHKCKKLILYSLLEITMHAQDGPTYACRKLCVQADSCVRIARFSFGLIFQILIYLLIKSYIFHFNTSQINLTSNWVLNQPWVLKFNINRERGP